MTMISQVPEHDPRRRPHPLLCQHDPLHWRLQGAGPSLHLLSILLLVSVYWTTSQSFWLGLNVFTAVPHQFIEKVFSYYLTRCHELSSFAGTWVQPPEQPPPPPPPTWPSSLTATWSQPVSPCALHHSLYIFILSNNNALEFYMQ